MNERKQQTTNEIVQKAVPIAESLVKFGTQAGMTENLTVWILALKMAVKIELDLYRKYDAVSCAELEEDCVLMDEIVSEMVAIPDPLGKSGDGFSVRALVLDPTPEGQAS